MTPKEQAAVLSGARNDGRPLLILGAAHMQQRAYEEAHKLSLVTIGVDPDHAAACQTLADYYYRADLRDYERLLEIARRHRVRGVFTLAADYPMPALGRIAEAMDLPGPRPDVVTVVTDKLRMIEHASRSGIVTPGWRAVSSIDEAQDGLERFGGEAVLKPLDSSGSKGVSYVRECDGRPGLEAAWGEAREMSDGSTLLLEEYLRGPEFSVEVLVSNGVTHLIGITRKHSSGVPSFVEIGHDFPAPLGSEARSQVESFTRRVVEAFGLGDCAAHVELKLTDAGVILVEVAGRLGGGYINTELVPAATGVNVVREAIRAALGETVDVTPTRNAGAAVRFLMPRPGRIVSISGLDEIARQPGLLQLFCPYLPGDEVPVIRDSRQRKAYFIFAGASAGEAAERADRALGTVEITSR